MAVKVLVSYARQDQEFAQRLTETLRKQGLKVAADHKVPAGIDWADHLRQTVDEASAVLIVLTDAAIRSSAVLSEAGAALAAEKPIIPVIPPNRRMPAGVPYPLTQFEPLRLANLSDPETGILLRHSIELLTRSRTLPDPR